MNLVERFVRDLTDAEDVAGNPRGQLLDFRCRLESCSTIPSTYFRQLVVGKIGESVQTQWHEHGSNGGGEAPSG